ncbi:hypothetical protein JD844_013438 [Phrynosoma platyrhinos]|uniref:receptor protein-tyrosine kinase n=1 Tax=Phrynosoma platyrhinos TaxID=52577 RepID=A0ABQ7TLX1_PHRPL|nr:hypothetical protein JD844_013438 [Phrynosoma platyrhinos]
MCVRETHVRLTAVFYPFQRHDDSTVGVAAKCRYALGMQDRTIPDEALSASSSWSDSTAAKHSRLALSEGDGAWCPAGPVYPNDAEYLEIDLRQLHFLTLVGTQGRHANGHGKEFARAYRLHYSRDGHRWMPWRDRWGNEVISGNENTKDVVLKDLGPPIIARYVRFYPRADRVMSVCLRVHCNNMHTHGVSIFRQVDCLFKRSLATAWEPIPVSQQLAVDVKNPSARSLTVPLEGRLDIVDDPSLSVSSRSPPVVAPPQPSGRNNAISPALGSALNENAGVASNFTLQDPEPADVAQRRISDDDLTVHLSAPSDTIVINNTMGSHRHSNRYERIHSGETEYQEPNRARMKLPDLPHSAENSALLLSNPAYHLFLATYAQPLGRPAFPPPNRVKPINTNACGVDYMEPETTGCQPGFQNNVPHYAEADIINLQGVTGGNTYAVPAVAVDALTGKDMALGEFPRERLIFKEKLGEGQFGEVHLCEVENPQDLPNLEFPFNVRKGRPLLVAVKILRSDATKNARNDFLKEVKIMSRLKDLNIVRLLGVCVQDDPLCMITEYMENGDLNHYPTLIHVGAQIASGMAFLASLNFVHRDLATRNCLVGEGFTIKIADFGMSRNLYAGDYYRIQGRAVLPIRWMAWECILMCLSFHFQVYLSRPPACPLAVYEVMLRCWAREAKDRPSFQYLHRFLAEDALNMV